MTEERDPYAVLGVPSTANQEDVAAAYRAKARLHHPDVSLERDAEHGVRVALLGHRALTGRGRDGDAR